MATECMSSKQGADDLCVRTSHFGSLDDGRQVTRFDLSNGSITVSLINYGATILSVLTPDHKGVAEEVTLAYDTLDGVTTKSLYFGSTVGRVANRVAHGRFTLDGKEFTLAVNNGPNHLHGGIVGFDKVLWDAEVMEVPVGQGPGGVGMVGVRFKYVSPDGEEGYPGTMHVEVTYSLTSDDKLEMDFKAESDAPTPAALTNHAYWNLSGNLKRKVTEGHTLKVNASRYCVLNEHMIPTGELLHVEGTDHDLREETRLGDRMCKVDGGGKPGFDHCFAVDGYEPLAGDDPRAKLRLIATLRDPESGRAMDVYSTHPGVQVYTSNWLSEDPAEAPVVQHNACCLETEFFPNAINESSFGQDIVIRPGKPYRHMTMHHFYVKKD